MQKCSKWKLSQNQWPLKHDPCIWCSYVISVLCGGPPVGGSTHRTECHSPRQVKKCHLYICKSSSHIFIKSVLNATCLLTLVVFLTLMDIDDKHYKDWFYILVNRFSTWPMTLPVQWWEFLTSSAWCCCCATGMAVFSSWYHYCRISHQTAGCPWTKWL